ncbi:hypothetical protein GQX74_011352 [Glossina fuscipes]|nr:hypothetical protein GQX74_011352 [Glossina fuscipes]
MVYVCILCLRFMPWDSNITLSLFDEEANDDSVPFATSNYNKYNLQADPTQLKVWLRQRQLYKDVNGFNTLLLTVFIVYLFKQRKLHISGCQVSRKVWNQLAFSSWHESNKSPTLCPSINISTNQPTLEQTHAYYPN